MHYLSTNNPDLRVDLKEAVLRSLPADNGLYLPERLPVLDAAFWAGLRGRGFAANSLAVAEAFFGDDVPREVLGRIVAETLAFDAPLVEPLPGRRILELFHGPTLAFKDFGARFMARLMAWLTRGERGDGRELTVLVATSGDTGGAVASAFHRVPGTRVVILYPSGMVSGLQEKQLTTLGDNITALEVAGSFDDCQRLVKAAFLDRPLAERLNLTSANSINLARLVPQAFYYVEAARQLPAGPAPVFVVPSGNFGNLTAGLLAARLGLPVARFVAATNANDVVPRYLAAGRYHPHPTIATISNAMDVGAPSNFARMLALFGGDHSAMAAAITGFAFDDAATRAAIRTVYQQCGHLLDPHTAVGWLAAEAWHASHPHDPTVILATAHPAKFPDVIEQELGPHAVAVPDRLARLAGRPKAATPLPADECAFLGWLRGRGDC